MTAVFHLLQYKPNLPAIILRSRCKVQPIDGASSFKDEFIKLLLFLVGNVYQNGHVAEGLRISTAQPFMWFEVLLGFSPALSIANMTW